MNKSKVVTIRKVTGSENRWRKGSAALPRQVLIHHYAILVDGKRVDSALTLEKAQERTQRLTEQEESLSSLKGSKNE